MGDKEKAPLSIHLSGDWIAAFFTALGITPAVAIIDRAIIANAAGTMTLGVGLRTGCRELVRPMKFVRQPNVLAVCLVYFGTYGTANSTESICHYLNQNASYPKLVSSSAANLGLTIWKDQFLARLYGANSGINRPFPMSSYGLFAVRDIFTMGASFTLPPIMSKSLQQSFPSLGKNSSDIISQLLLPTSVQLITTPLHLFALDIYNNPKSKINQRMDFIRKETPATTVTRMFRMLPAFGLGGTYLDNLDERTRNRNKDRVLCFDPHEQEEVQIPYGSVSNPCDLVTHHHTSKSGKKTITVDLCGFSSFGKSLFIMLSRLDFDQLRIPGTGQLSPQQHYATITNTTPTSSSETRWISPVIQSNSAATPGSNDSSLVEPSIELSPMKIDSCVMNIKSILNHPGEVIPEPQNIQRKIVEISQPTTYADKCFLPLTNSETSSKKMDTSMITPRVFQCASCHVIFGDSYAQVEIDEDVRILSLSATTVYVRVMDQLRMYQEGPFKNSAYHQLQCANCQNPVGSRFISTNSDFNHIRDYFSFDIGAIISYRLGPCDSNKKVTYTDSRYHRFPDPSFSYSKVSNQNHRGVPPLSPATESQNSIEFQNKPSSEHVRSVSFGGEVDQKSFDLFGNRTSNVEDISPITKHRKAQPHRSLLPGVFETSLRDDFTPNEYSILYSRRLSDEYRNISPFFMQRENVRNRKAKKFAEVKPARKKPEAVNNIAVTHVTSTKNNKSWKCAWCFIPGGSTPTKRRGPEGPKTLCNACGLCFSKKGMLPADRQFWYAQGSKNPDSTAPDTSNAKITKRQSSISDEFKPAKKQASSDNYDQMPDDNDSLFDDNSSFSEDTDSDIHNDETSAAATIMLLMQPSQPQQEIAPELNKSSQSTALETMWEA
ncbi:hypothetical protein HK096_003146 [Nowakowskiella sp. JEL0078]|nr:hypothetical protein HK096_003146 [Nowakowskiella sp. JEL0078]